MRARATRRARRASVRALRETAVRSRAGAQASRPPRGSPPAAATPGRTPGRAATSCVELKRLHSNGFAPWPFGPSVFASQKGGEMTRRMAELTAIAVAATLAASQSAIARGRVVTDHHAPSDHVLLVGTARATVERAVHGAIRRLSRPRCQQVFEDFTDHTGRGLAVNLAATGKTAALLMAELLFVDADQTIQCRSNEGLAAFTVPGSRVIHVCAKRFGHFAPNTTSGEIVLIHELLHSLGLGENPPTSSQITEAVLHRCG